MFECIIVEKTLFQEKRSRRPNLTEKIIPVEWSGVKKENEGGGLPMPYRTNGFTLRIEIRSRIYGVICNVTVPLV